MRVIKDCVGVSNAREYECSVAVHEGLYNTEQEWLISSSCHQGLSYHPENGVFSSHRARSSADPCAYPWREGLLFGGPVI